MSNIKCEIVFNLESGDYDIRFHNLSAPGEPMDYLEIRPMLARVLQDFDDRNMESVDAADTSDTPRELGTQHRKPRGRSRGGRG